MFLSFIRATGRPAPGGIAIIEKDVMPDPVVKKAVFPVAGLGTRFLPATKAMPKELLPVIDKPIIQYAVEEAIAAGITDLIFIQSIVPPNVNCIYIRQAEALGLGHAVLCAEPAVGNEPFAVLLADDLILAEERPTSALVKAYAESPNTLLVTKEVDPEEVSKYGIIRAGRKIKDARVDVEELVEKPAAKDAPSNMASIGRYILEPEIFRTLRDQPPGHGGEIQLADAINKLAGMGHVHAIPMTGHRYDCGSKFGYLEAILDFALANKEYGPRFEEHIRKRLKRK